ncbi:MAG: hypothetical protein U1F77_06175 [Kiritimatiellia bacterium]
MIKTRFALLAGLLLNLSCHGRGFAASAPCSRKPDGHCAIGQLMENGPAAKGAVC